MEADPKMSPNTLEPLYEALHRHLEAAPKELEKQENITPLIHTGPCIIASGSGDSLAAALSLAHALPHTALALDPVDALATPWLRKVAHNCTLIALSVGGRTTSLVKLAQAYAGWGGRIIAFTADPTSPLARASQETLRLTLGESSGGAGGLRHLVMLAALARALTGERISTALSHTPPDGCPGFRDPWTYLGAGDSRGSAYFASLKAAEVMGVNNPPTSIEEVLHAQAFSHPTRYLLLKPSTTSPDMEWRLETAVRVLSRMGETLVWLSLDTPMKTAVYHSYHILRCLEKEARERRVEHPIYKSHPHLQELTQAIYGTPNE